MKTILLPTLRNTAALAALAVAAWLPLHGTAHAGLDVTAIPPPNITSFVPSRVMVGESLLINHSVEPDIGYLAHSLGRV